MTESTGVSPVQEEARIARVSPDLTHLAYFLTKKLIISCWLKLGVLEQIRGPLQKHVGGERVEKEHKFLLMSIIVEKHLFLAFFKVQHLTNYWCSSVNFKLINYYINKRISVYRIVYFHMKVFRDLFRFYLDLILIKFKINFNS